MPEVPYRPVPDVAPSARPTPFINIGANPAAFGVNIGQALEHAGASLDADGNELFSRALALQQLKNQAEHDQLVSKYEAQLGQIHADYTSMQGLNAVNAQAEYNQKILDLRTQIGEEASNPQVRRMYDSSSLSMQGRTLFNFAGHAGTQLKVAQDAGARSRVKAAQDYVGAFPDDEKAFQQGLQEITDQGQYLGSTHGWDAATTQQYIYDERAKLLNKQISGLAKNSPWRAQQLFDAHERELGDLREQTLNAVQSATRSAGARGISSEVRTGSDLSYGAQPIDPGVAGKAIKQIETGGVRGDPYQHVENVETKSGHALGAYGFMSGLLPEFLKEAGMPQMSEQQFLKSPEAQDELFKRRWNMLQEQEGSANGAAARWIGVTGHDAYGTDAPKYTQMFNRELAKNASLRQLTDEAVKRGQALAPKDPLIGEFVQRQVEMDYAHDQAITKNDVLNDKQTISGALVGTVTSGKVPTSLEELTLDPEVKKAWDNLPATDQLHYLDILSRNAKGDYAMTPDGLREYARLKGEAAEDPSAFLEEDIIGKKMPIATRKELLNLQQRVRQNPEGDPQVNRAMLDLDTALRDNGITKKEDPDTYFQFRGQLEQILQEQLQGGKKVSYKEVQEIGKHLLQNMQMQKRFLGVGYTGSEPFFNVPVPDDFTRIATPLLTKELGRAPTDREIQRLYVTKQFQQYYGKGTETPNHNQ
jgi:hypothetical protein